VSYIAKHLMPGEEVVRVARITAAVYLPSLLLLALSAVLFAEVGRAGLLGGAAAAIPWAFLALAAVAAAPAFVRRQASEFAVTTKRVVAKTGLFSRRSSEILIRQVEGITVEQGLLGRMLNFGTIIVEGTGVDRTPYRGIGSPMQFRMAVQEQADAAPRGDAAGQGRYADLARIDELRRSGALSEEEFAAEKRRILSR
jgi:membrane protein YdbS with pleckstrin-like domain